MAIKTFKPYTPARRNMTVSAFDGVDKKAKPERSLVETLKKNAGRNSYGRITVRHRGGGNKRKYRVIDFKRQKLDMPATVERLEYDPNRSAYIALIRYEDNTLSYILAPNGLKAGDVVVSSAAADIKPGNCLPIANIPVGTVIHNVELQPGYGAQLVRSAGAAAQLMAKEGELAQIVCPPARSATSAPTAPPASVRWATWIMRTSTSARLAVPVIWVSVLPSVAPL